MYDTYRLKEGSICDEHGIAWPVYGIEAADADGKILFCFSDIFFDREKATAFVRMCNEQQVEPVHIQDVISNALAEQYTV